MDIDRLMEAAIQHHQRGDLAAAAALYQQVLQQAPNDADALHLLGLIRHNQGQLPESLSLFQRACEADPDGPVYQVSLGRALLDAGHLDQALAVLQRAEARAPQTPELQTLLGINWQQLGRHEHAVAHLKRAIEQNPQDVTAHHRLGLAYAQQRQFELARKHLEQAVALAPTFAMAQVHLGGVLHEMGNLAPARDVLARAVVLAPANPEAHYNHGLVLQALKEYAAAEAGYRRALQLAPHYVEALNNLGLLLMLQRRTLDALALHRRAVELRPTHSKARCSLATHLFALGMVGEAIKEFRHSLAQNPADPVTHMLLAFSLNYHDRCTPPEVFQEHVRWASHHATCRSTPPPHLNDPEANRKLRIGYISADFREHPVGFFIAPVLAHLDRTQFDIIGYSNSESGDELTSAIQSQCSQWLEVSSLSDDALAEQIRRDQVDVLVDLSGLTADNRLTALACKAAPVQVTHFGYPNTTGMRAMDYRITDALADPPGATEQWNVEKLWRLPQIAWCYSPHGASPEVQPPPVLKQGFITFGTLNNISKISDASLKLWAQLLHAVPRAQLMLQVPEGGEERVVGVLGRAGVGRERLRIAGRPGRSEYLALHHQIDVYLDPFPYNGGVTSCDAMWMGVPIVSLAGETYVSRQGVALLTQVGHPELVAKDEADFLKIATELAGDVERLKGLRQTLRQKLQDSPMMNFGQFAKDLGEAYRGMWRAWCLHRRDDPGFSNDRH
ncbi:MAG TPA: tetratricopeptide repeat protein [Tepidisphaeraceae bacterium]|jgi:predicted O-linked N-acetylglucosamine transferase (SPINDLY family)